MVKRVECLRQGEGVLGEYGEFQRSDDLFDHLVEPRRVQHELPQLMAAVGAQQLVRRDAFERGHEVGLPEPVTLAEFLEDVVCANDGVLNVRATFAFEAQCLFEIERNDLVA